MVNSSLFPLLCDYVRNHVVPRMVDKKLFSRLLQCSEADVLERLHFNSPAERLKDVVDQLYCSGFKLEAGSLMLSSYAVHPAIATVNSAVGYEMSLM